jgi:hypothetical protein
MARAARDTPARAPTGLSRATRWCGCWAARRGAAPQAISLSQVQDSNADRLACKRGSHRCLVRRASDRRYQLRHDCERHSAAMEPICGGPLPLKGRGGQYPSRARSDPFPELSSIPNRAAENSKKARRREPPGFAGLRREFRRHPPSCHCRLGRHWRAWRG